MAVPQLKRCSFFVLLVCVVICVMWCVGCRSLWLLCANGNVVANEAVGHVKWGGLLARLGVEVIVELTLNVECFDRH